MSLFRRAFTLVELLVVIAIFTILLAIGVPAFSSMLYSSEQSLAENAVRSALAAARDAAARSARGQDAAAVFFYDPAVGRLSIQPYMTAGLLQDVAPTASGTADREVFVPVPGFEPVNLPGGWMVRGYAPGNSIDTQWYEKTYSSGAARARGNWVFPETGFYDEQDGDDGQDRQTFMVRFEGGTGALNTSNVEPVLVFSPSASIVFRQSLAPWSIRPLRPDLESDPARLVRRILAYPPASLPTSERQKLLGDIATDTVLAKPVGEIAVYNERRLAGYLGVRTDNATNCLYRNVDPSVVAPAQREPILVPGPTGGNFTDADIVRLNNWIQGFDSAAGPTAAPLDSDCRIFTIQRYLGTLQEVTGTRGGQGLGT